MNNHKFQGLEWFLSKENLVEKTEICDGVCEMLRVGYYSYITIFYDNPYKAKYKKERGWDWSGCLI